MKKIIALAFLFLFTLNITSAQQKDKLLLLKIGDGQTVQITNYKFDLNTDFDWLILQCKFNKKNKDTEFIDLSKSIYLRNTDPNKSKIFPLYLTPRLSEKNSRDTLESIIIFKIGKNWNHKIYSGYKLYSKPLDTNVYKVNDSLNTQYEIEYLFYNMRKDIKADNRGNMKFNFEEIEKRIPHKEDSSNYLPIKYEISGDTIYYFKSNKSFDDTLAIANYWLESYALGNRDSVFLNKCLIVLSTIGDYYYNIANDDEFKTYYESAKNNFHIINEINQEGVNHIETLYKEEYSLYKILTLNEDYSKYKINDLQVLVDKIENKEKLTGNFEFTYKGKILLGNYYYYFENYGDAKKIYNEVIEATEGVEKYVEINKLAKDNLDIIPD